MDEDADDEQGERSRSRCQKREWHITAAVSSHTNRGERHRWHRQRASNKERHRPVRCHGGNRRSRDRRAARRCLHQPVSQLTPRARRARRVANCRSICLSLHRASGSPGGSSPCCRWPPTTGTASVTAGRNSGVFRRPEVAAGNLNRHGGIFAAAHSRADLLRWERRSRITSPCRPVRVSKRAVPSEAIPRCQRRATAARVLNSASTSRPPVSAGRRRGT